MIRNAPVDFRQIGDIGFVAKGKRELIDHAKLASIRRKERVSDLESRTIVAEQSMLEHTGWRCPASDCDQDLRYRPAEKVHATEDSWYYRIRCSCGAEIHAIND